MWGMVVPFRETRAAARWAGRARAFAILHAPAAVAAAPEDGEVLQAGLEIEVVLQALLERGQVFVVQLDDAAAVVADEMVMGLVVADPGIRQLTRAEVRLRDEAAVAQQGQRAIDGAGVDVGLGGLHDVQDLAGHLVPAALEAAGRLARTGIDVEVWDPRSLLPFDKAGLAASVAKTGRLVIADDSGRTCGFAAEVASLVAERCFRTLKAPIKRVTRADVTVAYSTPIEAAVLPDGEQIENAVRAVMASAPAAVKTATRNP